MADVFVSYKREERAITAKIVTALETAGYSVWWDNDLTPRTTWDEEIEREISSCKAVLVLWSPRSVAERTFVRREAGYALDHGKLVPAWIKHCDLPLRFRDVQTADLADWDCRNEAHSGWRRTLGWIADLVGRMPSASSPPSRPVVARQPSAAEPESRLPPPVASSARVLSTLAVAVLGPLALAAFGRWRLLAGYVAAFGLIILAVFSAWPALNDPDYYSLLHGERLGSMIYAEDLAFKWQGAAYVSLLLANLASAICAIFTPASNGNWLYRLHSIDAARRTLRRAPAAVVALMTLALGPVALFLSDRIGSLKRYFLAFVLLFLFGMINGALMWLDANPQWMLWYLAFMPANVYGAFDALIARPRELSAPPSHGRSA